MASPFVRTVEYDKSKMVSPFGGLYGLVIGNFDKGRIGERMFVGSQQEMDLMVGTPQVGSDVAYYIGSTYLQKSQRLWLYRVANNPIYASILVGSTFVSTIGTGDGSNKIFNGKVKFERCHPETVTIWVDDEKIGYDNGEGDILGTQIDTASIDYETGEVNITFSASYNAPANGAKVYAKWGFPCSVVNNGIASLDEYDFAGSLTQSLKDPTDSTYEDLLVPFPLYEPQSEVTESTGSTLFVKDGDQVIAYADEYGNLVDTDDYLAPAVPQITEVTCNGADTLEGGEYFLIYATNPATTYYVWYTKDGVGVDPNLPNAVGVQIDAVTGDMSGDVATKTQSGVDVLDAFDVVVGTSGTLTVTNTVSGYVNDAEDESTGFTISVTQDGVGSGSVDFTSGTIIFDISDSYTVSSVDGLTVEFQSRTKDYCMITGDSPGVWINGDYDLLIKSSNVPNNYFDIFVYASRDNRSPVIVDNYRVSNEHKLDGFDQQMFLEDRINDNSYYIRTLYNTYVDEIDDVFASEMISHNKSTNDYESLTFVDGDNGDAVTVDDYTNALKTFDNKDDVKVDVLMDTVGDSTFQLEMLKACDWDFGGRGDCYAVNYVPFDVEMNSNYITEAIKYRNYTLATSSSFGGLYFGHVQIRDTYNSRDLWIPPVGFIGAAFSYTSDQYEPWFPAAGWDRGLLPVNTIYRKLSQGQRDALYDNDINAMKFKPGRGIAIWGQKTLYGIHSALDRANVRWLLIVAENAIEDYMENHVFDLNDAITRNSARITVSDYLRSIQLRRGLYNFDVICDLTNNPPDVIDANRMNIDYYLQPVKAAEFIYARAVITRTGVNFENFRIT